ncbi:MAG: insulinase family protein [Acidobacteriota bacterium]|jgi:zinc protease
MSAWKTAPLLLLAALAACSTAPLTPELAPAPAVTGELPAAPELVEGRLRNGLCYGVRENARPENRAFLWLVVDAGSVQEDDDQRGLAHFVEHMAFNGTEHFHEQELVGFLERIGMQFGPDINAYTSFDETVYMLQLPADDREVLETGLQILRDWADGLLFDDQEIDAERGVILEEWRLGQGAASRVRDLQWPVLFEGSRYAERLPIGDEAVIRSAAHQRLRAFYRDWYRPDLMSVVAVGDFDGAWMERQIRRRFRDLRGPEDPRPRETAPVPDHEQTLLSVVTDPELTSTSVSVYYLLDREPFRTAEDYRRQIVEDLHHGMLRARLDEVRRRPDPPFLFGSTSSGPLVRSRNVYTQGVVVEEGGALRGLEALLEEVERVERFGFTAAELERQKKDYLRGYEQLYRERDKIPSGALAAELRDHFLEGEPVPGIRYELELVRRFLPGITVEEVNALSRSWIRDENRVILFSGPESDDAPPPEEGQLLAVLASAEERELEPWVDEVRQGPLVPEPPEPGRVVSESRIDDLDVTEWELSNGVRVVLKPTSFQNDQVLLTGFRFGGHSLVPDEEYRSAAVAASLVGTAGIGEFSLVELDKALAGKVASAAVSIDELEERASGRASPEDLETMFELLYLRFTAPRRDDEAIASWLARQEAFLENRDKSPEVAFSDEMARVLSQDHPRRRPWTEERLEEIDPETSLRVYRERFSDATGFTFVLVGNFEVEAIRPLVARWLGGLPAAGGESAWRDVGVRSPDGVHEVRVERGLEPKAQVQLVFLGPATWSREDLHDIGTLAAALRIRLREVLREDLGGTYGVSVSGNIARWPREWFRLTIGFGCAPENVEELTAATFDAIESFQEDGVDDETIAKVREGQVRQREVGLQENGFWLGMLANYYRHDLDPRLILDYETLLDRDSSERIRDAARRYLPLDHYVRGVLLPAPPPAAPAAGSPR